jgi:hypothetical protein
LIDRSNDPAFLYFPDNYRWSMGLLICLSGAPWGGAEIDEVNRVGRALRDKVGDDDAWFEEWTRMGDVVEARGRAAEADGYKLTAASCFLRATRYYQTGERFLQPKSQRGMEVYAKSVTTFRDAAAILRTPRIEHVEIPYEGTSLPALLVHPDREAAGAHPAPAMVYFDGFDVTKEIQYGYAVPDLAARGVGCLIVDGPGNGESVRFRKLPLIAETERYATPVYDYLASRPEFDEKRIGVMALSLGGYYAPRAASLEPRYACCIAWGAQGALAVGAARAPAMGTRRRQPGGRAEGAGGLPPRRHRAEDALPVPAAARRRRRADFAIARAHAVRRGRFAGEDATCVHQGGGRLPPLPGRQHHHRRPHHVGLGVRRAEAGRSDVGWA